MRTVALRFEQVAAFKHEHAKREQKECSAPPVDLDFFHSQRFF